MSKKNDKNDIYGRAEKPWKKNFGLWMPDKDIRDTRGFISPGVIGAVAGARRRTAGVSYLLAENFETPTTGYDNALGAFTEGGTISPAYTTNPIVGSQSCRAASNWCAITSPVFTGQTDVWAFIRIKSVTGYLTSTGGAYWDICKLETSSGSLLCSLAVAYRNSPDRNIISLYCNGGNSSESSFTFNTWANNVLNLWLHYVASGTCQLFATQGNDLTRPTSDSGSGTKIERTGGTGTAAQISVQRISAEEVLWDHIRISTSEIGDDPV
jgi:hypothetical protein